MRDGRWALVALVAMASITARAQEPSEEAPVEQAEAETPAADADADARLAEARERIGRGEQLYADGSYEAALAEFTETLDLLRGHQLRYLVLYNMAKCQERLFLYDAALASYRAFLEQGGAFTELEGEVRAKIDMLDGLLGTVRVSVNARNYEVWVDDRRVGEGLDTFLVPGGTHKVEIRADGYVPAQQEVQVAARAERSLNFELERLAEEFEGLSPVLFWSATGVAVVAVGVGAGFGIRALQQRSDVDARTPPLGTDGESDDIRKSALLADVMFAVAGAAAITAVIFALFTDWGDDDDDPSATRLRLDVGPTRGGLGVGLGGSF
ncbi:MAG: PEGA domain-containing protein [Sandaracinus sp.]|nr:PEGA domain-containing protein [Sandaracinus sp.]